jgi:hypothetical protein
MRPPREYDCSTDHEVRLLSNPHEAVAPQGGGAAERKGPCNLAWLLVGRVLMQHLSSAIRR